MQFYDTIAAVSTPRGKGGVAMIRISGEAAVTIAERVFFPRSGKPLSAVAHGMSVYGDIRVPVGAPNEGESIDDGLAVCYYAPRSFTGENTVEICCHGGILVTETVLSAVLSAGARPAEAGEFTRRAFVNGKMALSEAEALGTLLEAKTESQMRLSRGGMRGRLTARVEELAGRLRHILASVYARIDYPDEELADLSDEEMHDLLTALRAETLSLADTYRTGRATMEGINTVICGPANAGKSSLYNLLVGREAAIVTDVAGTTRDMLSETVALGKVTLRLTDTAGLRDTEDRVEQIGIARAREALTAAELVLAVVDGSSPATDEERELLLSLRERASGVIVLLNKRDRGASADWEKETEGFVNCLTISLKDDPDTALSAIRTLVEQLFTDGRIDLSADAVVMNARQYSALCRANEMLSRAIEAIDLGVSADIYCTDAEEALGAYLALEGRDVGEAVVAEIFSSFCVGK